MSMIYLLVLQTRSKSNLFADDVLLYRTIAQVADYAALQLAISLIDVGLTQTFSTLTSQYASI